MRYCKNCKLTYGTPLNHCLFCNNELTEDNGLSKLNGSNSYSDSMDYHYPQFQKRKKARQNFLRFIYFLIIMSIISCIFLDLTDKKPGISWSLYTTTCCLYVLYLVRLCASKQKKIKKITYSAYASIILNLLIGLYTDSPFWAIDFILPLGILGTNLCVTFYFLFRKREELHNIVIYNLVACLLGLIPLILFFTKQLTYTWPSITCGLYSLIILSGLMFFSTSQTKDELKRRFHL